MKIRESELEMKYSDKIIALPSFGENSDRLYTTDAVNCIKFLRSKIDIEFYHNPNIFWEQRSINWLGPTLFLTGKLLSDNPDLLNILFDMISQYIKERTPSRDITNIQIKVICKKTPATKSLEIDYNGNIEGLKEIRDTINSLLKD